MNELKKIVQDMREWSGKLDMCECETALQIADRLEALSQTHVLLPREPSEAMVEAMCAVTCTECHADCHHGPYAKEYAAAIRAAEGGGQ